MTRFGAQFALSGFTLFVSLCYSLPAQSTPAILLKQKSLMMGFSSLLYSKEGVRLDLFDRNQVIIMRPPNWQIQYANTNTKVYWEGDARLFKSNFTTSCSMFRPGDASTMKVATAVSEQLKGLDCKKYKLIGQQYGNSRETHTWQRLMVRDGNLWMMEAPGVPLANSRILNKCFGAPVAAGVPVRMAVINNGGAENIEFELRKVERKEASSADFKVPPNFKKVATQEGVNTYKNTNEDMAEIFK